jgi:hypothetical protein
MSFWLDAVLTRQYLINCLPTSTLHKNVTPFEAITNGRKPDLSHLRVWGCECFVAVPNELRGKAAAKRFRAIFVGYEEHRVGWHVRSLEGKYSFSNDVIFNEDISGRLGVPHPGFSTSDIPNSTSPRPIRDQPRARTVAGRAYDEVLQLKALWKLQREKESVAAFASNMNRGENGGAVDCVPVVSNGGAIAGRDLFIAPSNGLGFSGLSDLSPSTETLDYLLSFLASPLSESDDLLGFHSLGGMESDILWRHIHQFPFLPVPVAYHAAVFLSCLLSPLISQKSPCHILRPLLVLMQLSGELLWTENGKVFGIWVLLRRLTYLLVSGRLV